MCIFLKKTKKDTCRYHYQNLDMIYLWFLSYRANHIYQYSSSSVEIGNCRSFLPFHPPRNHNNQNFEKWKNLLDIILQMCTKNHNHDVWFLRYGVRQTEFFVIFSHFLPFYHIPIFHQPLNNHKKQNFEKKNEKNTWKYYPFIRTCVL